MRSIFLHTALVVVVLIASGQQKGENRGAQFLREGRMLFDSAEYHAAQVQADSALNFFQKSAQKNDLKAGEALLLLGDIFLELGNFEAAVDQFEEALTLFKKKGDQLLKAKALNGLGEYYYKKNDYGEAERYYRKALALRENQLGPLDREVANSYNNLGNCFASTGHYAEALAMHQKALDIRRQVLPAGHAAFAVSHSNLANCLYFIGDYAGALSQYDAALNIRLQTLDANHPKMALLYNNLGNCYAALDRTDMALRYYEQSLAIRKQHFGTNHPSIANVLENLGDLSVSNGDYVAALDNFREAYNIQKSIQGATSLAVALLQHKIGLCFQYKGDYARALQHHFDAERVFLAELEPEDPRLAELYTNIGNCYADKKEIGQAETNYRKSLQVFEMAYPEGHPAIVQAYNNLGAIYLDKKAYSGALALLLEAEKKLRRLPGTGEKNTRLSVIIKNTGLARAGLGQWQQALADCEKALQTLNRPDLATELELLSGQATVLKKYALVRQDWAVLRSAATVYARALDCLDSLRMQMTSSDTRLQWVTRKYVLLGDALEANFILWEKTGDSSFLETAFAIAERSKSLQLIENLRKEQAERFAGIPDSLLAKANALELEINYIENRRLASLQRDKEAQAKEAEQILAEKRRDLAALVADFEANYPDYFRLKYSRKTATPDNIRKTVLQADQAMTVYFATDSLIFAFIITQDAFKGVRIPRDFPLSDWVFAMRSSIQGYANASSHVADSLSNVYITVAHQLFEKIVVPVEKVGLAGHKKWIIVPDREMAILPFEALLRDVPAVAYRFKSHAYLLRDYAVSYAYSATQLSDLLLNPYQKPPKTMAAFAPEFKDNRYGLGALRHNRREARSVGAMFDGDILEGGAASAEAFRRDAGQYRMLLLATHGKASDDPDKPSHLVFSPEKDPVFHIYAKDLFQMRLPAELVVLSACETNIGEYRTGEGVISLAKGFFHAGTRSMVATLWSVDDAKNADLMLQFFQQIREGMPKDGALQQAKLNHLIAKPHDEAHPFFWAAAVATGDMAPMDFPSPWRWVFYGAAILAVGAAFWWFKNWVPFQRSKHRKA